MRPGTARIRVARIAGVAIASVILMAATPLLAHEAHRRPSVDPPAETTSARPTAAADTSVPVQSTEPMGAANMLGHEHHDKGDSAALAGLSFLSYLGRFHPVVVHFPIALLLTAFFIEVLRFVRPIESQDSVLNVLVSVAALTAPVAGTLGFLFASGADYPPSMVGYFVWHRVFGVATVILAVGAWAVRPIPGASLGRRRAFTGILALASLAVAVAGFLGASLTFGPGHLIP
jgi:uncharacterized membrane protein